MKKRNILKWIIFSVALATNLLIIVNSFMNGDASNAQSNVITSSAANTINSLSPGSITKENFETFSSLIRKTFGHFGLFGFSGIMTTWTFYMFAKGSKINYFMHFGFASLVSGIFIAWLSEFIQIFIDGRSGSAKDVVIDVAGYFIGVLLVIFILFLAKKPIFQKQNQEEK